MSSDEYSRRRQQDASNGDGQQSPMTPLSPPGMNMPRLPPGVNPETYRIEEVNHLLKSASYFSIFSKADPSRPNKPILSPDNPNEMIGVEVNEELHRFDFGVAQPTLTGGVQARKRIGEPVANVSIHWMVAPDDFEAAPGKMPPPTALNPFRSQRFVMLNGQLKFKDRYNSGFRAFGAGRTFPVLVGGKPQLRIGAVINILEGLGKLQGLPGTVVVNGYIQPPDALALNFIVRIMDPEGRLQAHSALSPLNPIPDPDPDTAFLVFLGEVDPERPSTFIMGPGGIPLGSNVHELLRLVHIGFDVSSAEGIRSQTIEGPLVGKLSATLMFNPMDPRPVSPIGTTNGIFTFFDEQGGTIGTLQANMVEGRSLRTELPGVPTPVFRFGGFGPLLGGTGQFNGAIGMLSLNAVVSLFPRTLSNMYVLRISDPAGRFRAVLRRSRMPVSVGDSSRREVGEPPRGRRIIPRGTEDLTDQDRNILRNVDRALARGLELHRWWQKRDAVGVYARRFELVRSFNQATRSFGFFDQVQLDGRNIPLMGVVQEMTFDKMKRASGEAVRDEFREFALRYFMRVSDFREPETFVESEQRAVTPYLRWLSWCPSPEDRRGGFGYEQHYYKRRDDGFVGKFKRKDRNAIVDMREIGPVYDWVVGKVGLYGFNLTFSPVESLRLALPLAEENYFILSPDFMTVRDNPRPGVLGEYSICYALINSDSEGGIFAYGPGHFGAGFQRINFQILESGEIRVRMAFVVNRPEEIMRVSVDPVGWTFRAADLISLGLASVLFAPVRSVLDQLPLRRNDFDPLNAYIQVTNTLTGGLAGQDLCVTKEQLEKRMLVQHFRQHYEMIVGSLLVWRMIPCWLDTDALPRFAITGVSS